MDFSFIGKKKKFLYVTVLSQLKYKFPKSRISKPFTVVGIEQPHSDCKVNEVGPEHQNFPDVVVQILCTSGAVHVREGRGVMQSFERCSFTESRSGNNLHRLPAPVCKPEGLTRVHNAPLYICKYLPNELPEFLVLPTGK